VGLQRGGEVTLVEPLGAETLVHLLHGGNKMIMRSSHGQSIAAGQDVTIAAAAEDLRFFDRAGRSLT
jgi:ABC-type sugar transport systems, ATPase components